MIFVLQGKIPKNDFGNINLFVESMLPYGATHLPCKSHQVDGQEHIY